MSAWYKQCSEKRNENVGNHIDSVDGLRYTLVNGKEKGLPVLVKNQK